MQLITAEAVDFINIKLMKCGGILKGRKIAEVAEAAGVPCMIGCMSESEIGIAAAAHLAAGVKNIQYADLDSDLLFRDRIVEKGGIRIKNSARTFTKGCGLGLEKIDTRLLGKPSRIYK
jgi:L-alanine-DL-glutamate epimerase-like enolase superfamily enzyme